MPPLLVAAFEELGLGAVTESAIASFESLVAGGASEAAAAEQVAASAATAARATSAGAGRGLWAGTKKAVKGAFSPEHLLSNLVAFGLVMPVTDRLVHGSAKQQMKEQMDAQEEYMREHGMAGGGGAAQSPEEGLLAQAQAFQNAGSGAAGLLEMQDQYERSKELADLAYRMHRARKAHPFEDNQRMMDLIGNDARIAQLTSERILTTAEIRQRAMAVMDLDDNGY